MILPFSKVDGEWTLSDEALEYIWVKAQEQKLDKIVFTHGGLKSRHDFITMMKNPSNLPIIIADEEKERAVGIAWLNGIGHDYAHSHFFFFREYWGNSEKYGNEILNYWFSLGEEKPLFKTLIGVIPESNRRAISFAKRLGYEFIGNVPHVGAVGYKLRGD